MARVLAVADYNSLVADVASSGWVCPLEGGIPARWHQALEHVAGH